ncbi:family 1 encapsulin nanocompartment shell protein [Tissierella creatinophila]|uniref:Type 1 encapsulin shell protein n=1 Tax=Tissierella creatinophila DSM 6911 TaxID=1123403 RepID=A0A1U7M2G8_TISCR|nr:family 1 encapsulin nanocompartment shell protein [Tissierella creatinophila]OLS01486.1 maritimacin [Tissierella creatinophila DSM 6911]
MLYRDISPVTKKTWEEIDQRATEVLKSYLSARKVVHVVGPKGLEYNAISEGRLANVEEQDGVFFGNYQVVPLTEIRIEFEMDRWELDNVERGAKDVDYEPLEKAMENAALFEEKAIFNGLDKAIIQGLDGEKSQGTLTLGSSVNEIMDALTQGIIKLRKAYVKAPYTLVVSPEAYKRILSVDTGYPLVKRIEDLIGGKIVLNQVIEGAYLLPYDNEDLELTIGRDFSIGYQNHTNEKVKFFIKESFTFRVLDENIIIKYNLN